jgi:hypothetical protein
MGDMGSILNIGKKWRPVYPESAIAKNIFSCPLTWHARSRGSAFFNESDCICCSRPMSASSLHCAGFSIEYAKYANVGNVP